MKDRDVGPLPFGLPFFEVAAHAVIATGIALGRRYVVQASGLHAPLLWTLLVLREQVVQPLQVRPSLGSTCFSRE